MIPKHSYKLYFLSQNLNFYSSKRVTRLTMIVAKTIYRNFLGVHFLYTVVMSLSLLHLLKKVVFWGSEKKYLSTLGYGTATKGNIAEEWIHS